MAQPEKTLCSPVTSKHSSSQAVRGGLVDQLQRLLGLTVWVHIDRQHRTKNLLQGKAGMLGQYLHSPTYAPSLLLH